MPCLRSQLDHFNIVRLIVIRERCAVGELTSDQSRNRNQGKASFPCGFISTTSIGHYFTTSLESAFSIVAKFRNH